MMRRQMVGPVKLPRISRNNKSGRISVAVKVIYPSLCEWRTKQNDMRDWSDVPRVRLKKSAEYLGRAKRSKTNIWDSGISYHWTREVYHMQGLM
jgi:uncharacterized MAPEG superfamily protein